MSERFQTYYALGEWVKESNPNLSLPSATIGRGYHKDHPEIEVEEVAPEVEEPEWRAKLRTISQVPDALVLGLAERVGRPAAVAEGFLSGRTLGATEHLAKYMGNPSFEGSFAYGAGELAGEVSGPFAAANKFFRPLRGGQMANVGVNALEGGVVDLAKGVIDPEIDLMDAISRGYTTALISGGMEGAVRGGVKGGQKAMEKWLGPAKGEIDEAFMAFLSKYNLPTPADVLRPASRMVQYYGSRVKHSVASADIFRSARSELAKGIINVRNGVIAGLGDNPALMAKGDVGHVIHNSVLSAREGLKKARSDAYEALRRTKIFQTPIKANQKFIHSIHRDSAAPAEYETTLMEGLRGVLGDRIIDGKSATLTGTHKKLRAIFNELKEAHVVQDVDQVVPGDLRAGLGTMGVRSARTTDIGQAGLEIPQYDYQWWWDRLQTVGDLFETSAVKKSDKLQRKVGAFYHMLQDGIDAQAKAASPDYTSAIDMARSLHQNYMEYISSRFVRLTEQLADKGRPDQIVGRLFSSVDNVIEAKRVLGPDAFNAARQGWIRDFLFKSVNREAGTAEEFVNASGMMKAFDDLEGIDGPFFAELFSESNFVDLLTDAPIQGQTDALAKYNLFQELVDNVTKMDAAIRVTQASAQEFGAGVASERAPITAIIAQGLRGDATIAKGVIANLLLLGKASEHFISAPGKNIFLGAKFPSMGIAEPMLGGVRIPRNQLQSAAASAIAQ